MTARLMALTGTLRVPITATTTNPHRASAVALTYFAYNFIRIHRTLKVTPAMAAGVTERLWEVSDLVGLLEASESKKSCVDGDFT